MYIMYIRKHQKEYERIPLDKMCVLQHKRSSRKDSKMKSSPTPRQNVIPEDVELLKHTTIALCYTP